MKNKLSLLTALWACLSIPVAAQAADCLEPTNDLGHFSRLEKQVISAIAADQSRSIRPFSTDGCSVSPNGIPFLAPDVWADCCIDHDIAYWIGGSREDKSKADQALRACIGAKGFPIIGAIYYLSVSAMGGPAQPTGYRWGYGWNERRNFKPLSTWEITEVEDLYAMSFDQVLSELKSRKQEIQTSAVLVDAPEMWSDDEVAMWERLREVAKDGTRIEKLELSYFNLEKREYRIFTGNCPEGIEFVFDDRFADQGPKLRVRGACGDLKRPPL